MPKLPPPGSETFFTELLKYIHDEAPHLHIDATVLESLLVSMIAGDKHLILRTTDEDITALARLTASYLTTVFGYPTHRIKIKDDSDPLSGPDFLRSLFVNEQSSSRQLHRRSRSRAPESSEALAEKARRPSVPAMNSGGTHDMTSGNGEAMHEHLRPRSRGHHKHEKSIRKASMTNMEEPRLSSDDALLVLPRALVFTGLEHASMPAQRALIKALSDRMITLSSTNDGVERGIVHNLPVGFMIVCICGWDPREQPKLDRILLDRFAMSVPIPLIESAQTSMRTSHSAYMSRPTTTKAMPMASVSSSPILTVSFISSLQNLALAPELFATKQPLRAYISPELGIYIADLMHAARIYPKLDALMLTLRTKQDLAALIRAGRVLGLAETYEGWFRDIARAKAAEDELDSLQDDAGLRKNVDVHALISSEAITGISSGQALLSFEQPDQDLLDVTTLDIEIFFPRCIGHRIRVRDHWRDEVLASLRNVGLKEGQLERPEEEYRPTIKDILTHILETV